MSTLWWWSQVVVAAARLQLSRGLNAQLISGAILSPLAGGIYILMARHLGRLDLAPYVVIAPILSGLWGSAMTASGDAVTTERGEGTLELLVAAPAPSALVAIGRVIATTMQSLIAIPFTLVVAALLGVTLDIAEPLMFALGILGLVVSTVAVGLIFAGLFVMTRSATLFTTVINWPLWILGGTAFPIAMLPGWLQGLSALVALSWAAEILRGAARGVGPTWWTALGAVLVLAAVYFAVAARLFIGVERRVRADGSLASF